MKVVKININKILFFVSYTLFLIHIMCNKVSYISSNMGIIFYGFILITIINILFNQKYNMKSFILMCISILFSVITYIITEDSTFLILMLLLMSINNIEVDKIIKYDFILRIILLIFVVINYKLGFAENVTLTSYSIIRNSMGFSHPNIFGFNIMLITIEYIYFKRMNLKIKDYIFILLMIFIINYFSYSRTSMYMLIIVMIISFFHNGIEKIINSNKVVQFLLKNIIIVMLVLSLLLTLLYRNGGDIAQSLNSAFSGRLAYTSLFLNKYSITLFGQKIVTVSTAEALAQHTSSFILDNAYIKILLQYGVVTFLIMYFLYKNTITYLLNHKMYVHILILTVFAIYGIMENYFFNVGYNVFLILFEYVLFSKKKEILNEQS